MFLVHGEEGVGLTTFTIKVATYMMERRFFEYFFFFDLYDIKDTTIFRFKFNEITKFDYNGAMQGSIKDKKIFFLFDNCDDFLKLSPKEFYSEILTLIR